MWYTRICHPFLFVPVILPCLFRNTFQTNAISRSVLRNMEYCLHTLRQKDRDVTLVSLHPGMCFEIRAYPNDRKRGDGGRYQRTFKGRKSGILQHCPSNFGSIGNRRVSLTQSVGSLHLNPAMLSQGFSQHLYTSKY